MGRLSGDRVASPTCLRTSTGGTRVRCRRLRGRSVLDALLRSLTPRGLHGVQLVTSRQQFPPVGPPLRHAGDERPRLHGVSRSVTEGGLVHHAAIGAGEQGDSNAAPTSSASSEPRGSPPAARRLRGDPDPRRMAVTDRRYPSEHYMKTLSSTTGKEVGLTAALTA